MSNKNHKFIEHFFWLYQSSLMKFYTKRTLAYAGAEIKFPVDGENFTLKSFLAHPYTVAQF